MRTFIAIDLTEEIKKTLAGLQDELKKSEADVKWVDPENIHLTLKFLGEISEEQVIQIKEVLDRVTSRLKPFEIGLSGIGAFPKLDYAKVIWAGIEKGKKETVDIAKNVETELERLGFAREDREFTAHLTIGRVRSGKNKEALKKKILSAHSSEPIAHSQQVISRIILYQSTLTPQGPIYTPLHTATFRESSL
jgi:RNA 2',3'-cyclic 3'-phosphodiesterase